MQRSRSEDSTDSERQGQDADGLRLGVTGFRYADLYDPVRLGDLLEAFENELQQADTELFAAYAAYRQTRGAGLSPPQLSELLVRLAPHVGGFVACLFGVEAARAAQMKRVADEMDTIFGFRDGVVAAARKQYGAVDVDGWDLPRLQKQLKLLRQILAPESSTDSDPEFVTAHVGGTLHRLCQAFGATDEDADAAPRDREMTLLRDRLSAHPEGGTLFSAALE